MSKLLFLSVFAVATLSLVDSAGQPVPVTVYYESLCPDSIKFFTSQLYPTYTSPLKTLFQLKLVPYGKSTHHRTEEGSWDFKCHHGPNECYGNKVQACILKHISQEADQVKYINCLMATVLTNKNAAYPAENCATTSGLNSKNVVECANSTEGSELLSQLGDETEKLEPRLTSVPTIVFNENFNKKDQELAQTSFKAALCSYIKTDHPHECHGISPNKAPMMSAASAFAAGAVLLLWSLV